MKKIIFIISVVFVTFVGYSQGNATNASAKRLTVEEANRLNGVAQPTINGIPYSQYKAQQDALKQAKMAEKPVQVQSPQIKTVNVESIKASTTPQTNVATTTSTLKQTTPVVVPSPATQMIPAQTLQTSPVKETPVPVAGKSTIELNASTNAGTNATLVSMPTLATGNGTQPAVAVSQNKIAEQVQGQPKATEAVVTPPSVINAVKAPVKQN